jgi:hypothetical protein
MECSRGGAQTGKEGALKRRCPKGLVGSSPTRRIHNGLPWLTTFTYPYLLGLYLGDGHLANMPRTYRLRIFLDALYPRVIGEAEAALSIINPSSKVAVEHSKRDRLVVVNGYSNAWPELLPQHGPGRKHKRSILLAGWQDGLCRRYPDRLLRGLIHSDGSRYLNTIRHPHRTYRYPRYEFSNRSEDIRRIFCSACDQVGVSWRPMSRYSVSVARRESVAILDQLVGPKG